MQFVAEQFPELQTQRLQLRSLTIADSEAIFALRSNEEVNRFIGRKPAQTIADAAQFIQDRLLDATTKQGVYWAIELKSTGKLIGTICYWNINVEENSIEIGYELMPDMQSKGLMQEAITVVITWGFTAMNLDVITAFPLSGNDKSASLLEKNKFTYDKIVDDFLVYKLNKQTWQANQPT
jgi:ribosomal-protein-alanine N-acetyltransferase